jgi:hypothetical protein
MIAAGALIVGVASAAHKSSQNPNTAALWVGLAVGFLGVLGILGCLGIALLRWADDAKTPFAVGHYPDCADCSENVTWNERGLARQVRIHVTNNSRVGVQRVRAFMRVVQPAWGLGRDHFLHVQHDNDLMGTRHLSRNGDYLTVRQVVHFDVALVLYPDWATLGHPAIIRFEYADPGISGMSEVPLGSDQVPACWKIQVEVSGWTDFRDVEPASVDCDVNVDAAGVVSLTVH